jgi:hypothetical protein
MSAKSGSSSTCRTSIGSADALAIVPNNSSRKNIYGEKIN